MTIASWRLVTASLLSWGHVKEWSEEMIDDIGSEVEGAMKARMKVETNGVEEIFVGKAVFGP